MVAKADVFLFVWCLLGVVSINTDDASEELATPRGGDGPFECFDRPELFETALRVGVPEGPAKYRSFIVPPMSSNLADYAYAMENAFVVLPSQCALSLGLDPNVGDADRTIDQWMGRFGDLLLAPKASTALERDAILSEGVCGWVLFMHGSGGLGEGSRYSIMLAEAGYGVMAPDSFASKTLGLRYKAPVPFLASRLRQANTKRETLTFWCGNNVYEQDSTCSGAMVNQTGSPSYPLCYESNAPTIASHPDDWRQFYERVFRLRQLEMDYLVANLPQYIRQAPKVFLAGESEGGMAAARYYNPELEVLLKSGGRIILQWSCEWNYYVSCPANARIGGGSADMDTPILNMISPHDPYFAADPPSIAHEVAYAPGGYGNRPLHGNCCAQAKQQGFKHVTVMNMVDTEYHGLTVKTANTVRAALKAFVRSPSTFTGMVLKEFGSEGNRLCSVLEVEPGLANLNCTELGFEAYVNASEVSDCARPTYNFHRQYYAYGYHEMCSRLRPIVEHGREGVGIRNTEEGG